MLPTRRRSTRTGWGAGRRAGLLGPWRLARRARRRRRRPRDRRLPHRPTASSCCSTIPTFRRAQASRASCTSARRASSSVDAPARPRRPPDRRLPAVPRRPARVGTARRRPPARGQGARRSGAGRAHRRRAGGSAARPHPRAARRGAFLRGGDVRARARLGCRARLVVWADYAPAALARWARRHGVGGVCVEHFLLSPALMGRLRRGGLSVTTGDAEQPCAARPRAAAGPGCGDERPPACPARRAARGCRSWPPDRRADASTLKKSRSISR